jgi:hypothetical protein
MEPANVDQVRNRLEAGDVPEVERFEVILDTMA